MDESEFSLVDETGFSLVLFSTVLIGRWSSFRSFLLNLSFLVFSVAILCFETISRNSLLFPLFCLPLDLFFKFSVRIGVNTSYSFSLSFV